MKKLIPILFMNIIVIFTILAGCSVQNNTTESNAAKTKGTSSGNYPNRQIELVVPFAAGGGVDLAARAVADYLSKEWGQPVVVVNKTGGGGIVGAQYALLESKPDGYTVLMNNNSSTTMYEAGTTQPILTAKSHQFAARVAESPLVYAEKRTHPGRI